MHLLKFISLFSLFFSNHNDFLLRLSSPTKSFIFDAIKESLFPKNQPTFYNVKCYHGVLANGVLVLHFTLIKTVKISVNVTKVTISSTPTTFTLFFLSNYCDAKLTKIPKRNFIFARVKTGQVGT